jgi:hypothetical protein
MSTTLLELREMVALNTKDGWELTATAPSGDARTFKDALNLYEDIDYFRGCEVCLTSGTNRGEVRRVTGSDRDTQTITLTAPDLPAIPQPGDTAILVNRRGHGFRIQELDRALNTAIRQAHPQNKVPMGEVLTDLYSADLVSVVIPDAYTHLILPATSWQDTDGLWHPIRPAPAPCLNGVWVEISPTPTLSLGGDVRWWADGRPLRIAGYGRAAPLADMDDATTTDPEWLAAEASAMLLLGMRREENLAWGQYWKNLADALRPKLARNSAAGTVKIRD